MEHFLLDADEFTVVALQHEHKFSVYKISSRRVGGFTDSAVTITYPYYASPLPRCRPATVPRAQLCGSSQYLALSSLTSDHLVPQT